MRSRQRFVVIGVISLAIIIALVVAHGLEWIWVQFGLDDPFLLGTRDLPLSTLIAYGVTLIAVVVLLRHKATMELANEVVDELTKVTWPTREETGNATIVVIVAVLISAGYLGAFDAVWLALTDWILDIDPLTGG